MSKQSEKDEIKAKEEKQARIAFRTSQLDAERHELTLYHPMVKHALELIGEAHRNQGRKHPRKGVMLVGPSRAGKTKTIELYRQKYPDDVVDGKPRRRVIVLSFPSTVSTSGVMSDLLRDMGDPIPERGSVAERIDRFRNLLKALGVEVLIFDEAHHLVEGRADTVALEISRWLKGLMDRYDLAIVLAGTESVRRATSLNDEVTNRFFAPHTLQQFGDATAAKPTGSTVIQLGALRVALHAIAKHFSVTRSVDLDTTVMAQRFNLACDGLIGNIIDTIQKAGEYAINDDRETITPLDLARAYDLYFGLEIEGGIGNPFTADAKLVAQAHQYGWGAAKQRGPSTSKRVKAKRRQTKVSDVIKINGRSR